MKPEIQEKKEQEFRKLSTPELLEKLYDVSNDAYLIQEELLWRGWKIELAIEENAELIF